MGNPNFVASTISLRRSPKICPIMVSDPPRLPYVSAVSNSVIPTSMALSITLRVASKSMNCPKLLQPSPITETSSPEFPRLRFSIPPPFLQLSIPVLRNPQHDFSELFAILQTLLRRGSLLERQHAIDHRFQLSPADQLEHVEQLTLAAH